MKRFLNFFMFILLASLILSAGSVCEAKSFKGVKLTVAYMSGTYANAARLIADEFEKRTGAKVIVVDEPYVTLYEKEFTTLIANEPTYDVMEVAYQWDGQFAPYLESLEEQIRKDKEINIEDFIEGVARVDGIWAGVRFGIPNACDALTMVYRKDLFKEAGFEVPNTWDEYMKIIKNLTRKRMFGTAYPGGVPAGGFVSIFWSFGGHLLTPDWKPLINSEEGVRTLDTILEMLKYAPPGSSAYGWPETNNAFLSQRAATAIVWPSFLRGIADDPKQSQVVGKWALMPFPRGKPSVPFYSHLSAWNVAIPKASVNKEAGWAWIKYYTSVENQIRFFNEIGIGPTMTAFYQDPTNIQKHSNLPVVLESLEHAGPRFRVAQSHEAFRFLVKKTQSAMAGEQTSKEALDEVAKKWDELFREAPPKVKFTGDYIEY